jgi:Ca2+-transporting ATPase
MKMTGRLDRPWWAHTYQEILGALDVSADEGLDASEVKRRRGRFGANRLRQAESQSAWQILLEQFKSLIVLLLVAAAALSFAFGEWVEGVAITAVILINAMIGFVTELRAVRSMEALQQLVSVSAKVRRDGHAQEIRAEELVPGDIVLLEGGDVVTADLRLIKASKLQANESALTGESVPVSKQVESLEEDVPLAERSNMVFKGTAVTRGAGEGVVVATGMDTELGHISSLVEEAEEEVTPLEKRLGQLGRRLIWVTLVIGAFVAVAGILAGREILLMVETAIALAVASIPEGLPIVATIALARGMWRMARHNALINRLSAVETLGATNVILTDKTGTLTENRMTVTRMALPSGQVEVGGEGLEIEGTFSRDGTSISLSDDKVLRRALEVGVLCNNAALERDDSEITAVGDPVEVALLIAGAKADLERDPLLEEKPEVGEVAFDPEVKMMATFHEEDAHYRVAVKGALEAVIGASSRILTPKGEREMSDEDREQWAKRNDQMAEEGLRVLALATKTVETTEVESYKDLSFLGLVGLLDPPREEVRPALEASQEAGVQVIMVTGDQPATASNVALAVGLVEDDKAEVVHGMDLKSYEDWTEEERQRILQAPIFARVNPKQKLDLIAVHQDSGAIVAMTGDGVNDAPALKKADIGVAMGQRGTQVAREAADMVLKDDAFSTIVVAIEQGRVIFDNIRKFVLYLLSCNISEIMVVSLASIANAPLPIRPLQILFLNLVTDVFPALALGVGEGDPAIMERPPRDPDEPIMTRRHWLVMAGYGLTITLSVFGALLLAFNWLGMSTEQAVTISFLTLAFAQLWHVFNMRERGSSFLRNDITGNPFVWGALALCTGLLLAAVYVPGLADVLKVADPGVKGWVVVISMSLVPWALGQILKSFANWIRIDNAGRKT